jgi:hypothetical protein
MPGFVAAHPSLSRMKSIDRFSTFWRLCMNSSDCVAKEKECSDSLGKRDRSSPNAKVGDPGAVGAESEGCLLTGGVAMLSEVDRCDEGGRREPSCWRMRRSPEAPMPCSCSGTMGDLRRMCQSLLSTCPTATAAAFPRLCTHSPCHAFQLPRIEAHALPCVDCWRTPRPEQIGCALRLRERDIFGRVVEGWEGIEVGFFW